MNRDMRKQIIMIGLLMALFSEATGRLGHAEL